MMTNLSLAGLLLAGSSPTIGGSSKHSRTPNVAGMEIVEVLVVDDRLGWIIAIGDESYWPDTLDVEWPDDRLFAFL